MARAPLMLRNLLLNQKLPCTCQERTLRKFEFNFFQMLINVILLSHTSLVFFFFLIIKVYNGRKFSINSFGCFNY
jgi:hypothetical protein